MPTSFLRSILILAILAILGITAADAHAQMLSQWTFTATNAGPDNSPAANVNNTGSAAVATTLGMNNSYTFSSGNTITGTGTFTYTTLYGTQSTADDDVTATAGDPNGYANAWRIRGESNNINGQGGQGNGWALQAPQYSQGVQFSTSTVGYSNIKVSYDWYCTTQGVRDLQEMYTINGTSWINFNSELIAVSDGWESQTMNLSAIPAAANDPNFAIRLVSAYDTTLAIPNYGSADGGQSGVYNNNSGNWRFTDVTFTGSQLMGTPEPGADALLSGFGIAAFFALRRRRKQSFHKFGIGPA